MTTLTSATPVYGSNLLPGPVSRPGAGGGGGGPGLSTQDILRAIRQRIVMIILIWLFFSGLTVAGTIYAQRNHPKYDASALIRVESLTPPDPDDVLRREKGAAAEDIERELQNQTQVVRSHDVLVAALNDPELRRTNWFKESEARSKQENENIEDLLLDAISVGPVPDSNYLRVSATWRDKREVPIIVNVIVQQYVALVESRQKKFVQTAKEELTAELERSQIVFDGIKKKIDEFQSQNEFSESVVAQANEEVQTLQAICTELDMEVASRKAMWDTLLSKSPEDLPVTAELNAYLNGDPTLNKLQGDLLASQQIYDQATARYGKNHRVVRDAERNKNAADLALRQERAVKIVTFNTNIIEKAKRSYLEAQSILVAQKEKLNTATAARADKERKKAAYDSLLEERDRHRAEYEKLLDQKTMLEVLIRQKKTVQIEVTSQATTPERMSSPEPLVWIPGGALFGLLFAVGFAMFLELMDKSVRTPRDVAVAHLPVLGTIPTTDDDEVVIERVESACLDAPHSVVAEAFRNLRANLFFSAPAEQQGVILVTSPSGGNGKTTIASNLAISIALSGRRVLLVDSNFRRPALPRIFPNMREEGLSNILTGQGELKDFVTRTNIPGLDVMSSGPLPPNPAELLGSSYLRDVVVDARSRYDQVIFDGPPVLLVSDAMVLAGAVDGVLLVCEYRSTLRGALQRTQANLEAINVRIFGAVLNKVQSRAGGYFRKQYREFYEYHEADDEAPIRRAQLDSGPPPSGSDDEPGPRRGGGDGGAAATAQLAAPTAYAGAAESPAMEEADEVVSLVDQEPPLATTIDEYESTLENDEPPTREIGEAPAVTTSSAAVTFDESPRGVETDSGVIPDMKDVEELDDFMLDDESPAVEEPMAKETGWPEREEARPAPAAPISQVPSATERDEAPVEIDDSMLSGEDEIVMGEDEDDLESGSVLDVAAEEERPSMQTPEALDALPPGVRGSDDIGSRKLADDSAFDMLEDEIDLGDDLADLDSEEFRIDDKWDLDDDLEDPESGPSKPKK